MNKRKVPKIRFKGFHDDWEQRKLEDVIPVVTDYVAAGSFGDIAANVNYKSEPDYAQLVRTVDLKHNFENNDLIYVDKKAFDYLYRVNLDEESIVLPNIGANIGEVYYIKPSELPYERNVLGPNAIYLKPNKNTKFIHFLFQTADFQKKLSISVASSGQPKFNKTELKGILLTLPNNDEQQRIGECFFMIDHLITLHQKKCLERKKRDFTSVSISWEQRKAKELFISTADKGYPDLPVLSATQDRGMIRRDENSINIFHDQKNEAGYKRVLPGQFVIHLRSFQGGFAHSTIEGITSPAYTVFGFSVPEKHDSEYWKYVFTSKAFIRRLETVTYGIRDGRSISYDEFLTLSFAYPSKDEQTAIARYLDKLSHLITLHQRKLELLKRLRNSLVDRCFTGEKITMSKLIIYHGSPNRVIVPKFGFGEDRHDYGRGFYLTENLELAKEWAVCRPDETNGWVHKYELEMDGLNILDFQKYDVLSWLAELMKHRDAADSRRYKMLAQKFIEKYGIDTCGYDVITGWRANASYFYIAKEFVRDNIDIEILEELLSLGGLGIQFCIKSERAFAQLSEVEQDIMSVDYSEFNDRYNERDINARNKMRALVDSDANKVTHVFSTLFER